MRGTSRLGWLAASVLLASIVPTISLGAAAPIAGASSLPTCPLAALAKARGTVNITLWNSASRNNQTVLDTLTKQFNSSQHKVHVALVQQADYDDTWSKFEDGLGNGELPNVVQLQDINLAAATESRAMLPVQSCIKAAHYSTSDYLARALNYWKVNGVQEGMPWAVSAPVMYYNKAAFTKAGLNPDDPPTTMAEMIADAKKLKASGTQGMGLDVDPWYLETWLASANHLFVNRQNGRSGTASNAVFNDRTGLQIMAALNTLVRGGYAQTNPYVGPNEYDNLIGIGNGKYGMALDTSAALGTVLSLLSSGQYPGTDLGVGPFPVLNAKLGGGVEPGGSALYIVKKGSTPAQQAAAWQYITFMDSPASQATWSVGSGYIPLRKSSLKTATIKQAWKTTPQYKVAYQELLSGPNNSATAGAVIGAFPQVRTDEVTSLENMFQQGLSPKRALSQMVSSINSAMVQYNQRLGG